MKQLSMCSDLLVALPTYNERRNVAGLASRIRALPLTADILFVDDGSPDGTGAELDRLAKEMSGVHVIHRPFRQGIGSAHKTALRYAYQSGYRFLITLDADGTHPPEDIPHLMANAAEATVIVASRFQSVSADQRHYWQIMQSRLGHRLTGWLFGLPADMSNAFRLYCLDQIDPQIFLLCRSNGYGFFPESLYRLHQRGALIAEVPVILAPRQWGKSKMRLRDIGGWIVRLTFLRVSGTRYPHP